jgi:membrane protein
MCEIGPLAIDMRRFVRRLPMSWSDLKALLARSVAGWSKHNAPRMGAALAYYTLLSLMPLLLVLISVAGLVFGSRAGESRVMEQVQFLIGYQRAQIIEALLKGAQNRADGLLATIVGTLVLIFGATGVLVELREALNNIWDVPVSQLDTLQEVRRMVKQRLWSLVLVLGIVIALTVSLLFSASVSALGTLTAVLPAPEFLLHLLNGLFSFIANTIVFAAIYKFVPDMPLKWRDVILGAAVTSLLFVLGNLLLGLYLGKASFSSTYGAASSTVALAIWVYYSSQIFFLGAEFTKVFAETYGSRPRRKKVTASPGALPEPRP